jgi:hypothetical protein
MWKQQQAYGTTYPSTKRFQAMFDLDILGLRAGGAAMFDTFHASKDDSNND